MLKPVATGFSTKLPSPVGLSERQDRPREEPGVDDTEWRR